MKGWSLAALALALFAFPALPIGFRELGRPGGNTAAYFVELGLFALTALLLWIVRRKEGKSWASLGLGRPSWGQTAWLEGLGVVAAFAALAATVLVLQAFGIESLQGDSLERPMSLLSLMIVRAGVVEEITYRGVAIDRMAQLTRSQTLGWRVPLFLFGVFHYNQGFSGIVIAWVVGAIPTALFLWKRNLWANIAMHFLVDFIPNVLLPLLGVGEP
jgi:membrane protease YdiL (CAAX protease family)